MKDISAIIFDFDGVLVDSLSVWNKVDHQVFNKLCLPTDTILEFEQEIAGMNIEAVSEYVIKRYEISHTPEEISKIIFDTAVRNFKNVVKPKKGVVEFLKFVKEKNIKTAIASSNDKKIIESCLKANGIYDYFENIITSFEVEMHKPHPHVYLKSAEILGVNTNECLVFEDTLFGVLAGKNAGMKVFAMYDECNDYCVDEIKENCDKYFDHFEEVIEFFK